MWLERGGEGVEEGEIMKVRKERRRVEGERRKREVKELMEGEHIETICRVIHFVSHIKAVEKTRK